MKSVITICVDQEIKEELRKEPNSSKLINNLLIEFFNKQKNKNKDNMDLEDKKELINKRLIDLEIHKNDLEVETNALKIEKERIDTLEKEEEGKELENYQRQEMDTISQRRRRSAEYFRDCVVWKDLNENIELFNEFSKIMNDFNNSSYIWGVSERPFLESKGFKFSYSLGQWTK